MTPMQTVSTYLMWRGYRLRRIPEESHGGAVSRRAEKHADRLNRMLSGGMKRKVLLSMVLASEADIVFLDEPSTGLDPISRRELWEVLISLGQERFVFLTTHYLEEAEQVSDRIAILEDGKLLSIGTLEGLRKEMKYGFSLVFPKEEMLPSKFVGEKYVRRDGKTQIFTSEEEALAMARGLSEARARFSLNPVTLDDIFNFVVAREKGREEAK